MAESQEIGNQHVQMTTGNLMAAVADSDEFMFTAPTGVGGASAALSSTLDDITGGFGGF